jgi:probable HAF family extracellular repeat protein
LTDLGTLGGDYSSANKINNNGQITGLASMDDGSSHAFLYNDGQMTDLGILPGFTYSEGVDINAQGQVVGFNRDRNYNEQAFLYSVCLSD